MSFRPNAKRKAAKHDRNYGVGGRRGDAVRSMPCLTARVRGRIGGWCSGRIEASHAVARGMGGVGGDARSLVPHCSACHLWYGRDPQGYERQTGIDVSAEARRVAAELDESLGPEPCYLCGGIGEHTALCKAVPRRRDR